MCKTSASEIFFGLEIPHYQHKNATDEVIVWHALSEHLTETFNWSDCEDANSWSGSISATKSLFAITSSVAYSHRQCGVTRPKKLTDALSLYNKGSKRRGKKLNQNLGLKLEEGKQPMI